MIEAALSMAKVQFAHNRWANQLLLDHLAGKGGAVMDAPCSGNGSIFETARHLIGSQERWVHRLTGNGAAAQLAPAENLEALRKRWTEVDEQTAVYLDTLTDEAFVTERAFTLSDGTSSSLPLWHLLLQVTSHGVHTRGQLVSALRLTGDAPPDLSFLQFCLQARQQPLAEDEPEMDA